MKHYNRRNFLNQAATITAGLGMLPALLRSASINDYNKRKAFFTISLAEWSLHRTIQSGQMTNLDFPEVTKKKYGIDVVEYVSTFFQDKAQDTKYLGELLGRCRDNGVINHLIMVDDEGPLGDPDNKKRTEAVENHYKWVDAAKYLGCTTIRVNTYGSGSDADIQSAAVDGLSKLGEYAQKENINVIVENHGGCTSDGDWVEGLMKRINKPNIGTLPDFGNFCIEYSTGPVRKCLKEYDRYKGVSLMMPFAKGVSAKTRDFDANGNCLETDYKRMMKIVKQSGFHGYAGIEFEGKNCSEDEGIKNTKKILEKIALLKL